MLLPKATSDKGAHRGPTPSGGMDARAELHQILPGLLQAGISYALAVRLCAPGRLESRSNFSGDVVMKRRLLGLLQFIFPLDVLSAPPGVPRQDARASVSVSCEVVIRVDRRVGVIAATGL